MIALIKKEHTIKLNLGQRHYCIS